MLQASIVATGCCNFWLLDLVN